MPILILATKLYIPSPRSQLVPRPRLIAQLNEGLHRKLTLISASAGFGKTTLVCEWVDTLRITNYELRTESVQAIQNPHSKIHNRIAWLSLDEADSDSTRFLTYTIAAIQSVAPEIGKGVLAALQSSQPPSTDAILTALLNEIAALPHKLILVLDDYHSIDSQRIDQALAYVIDHLPPQMHLVITTREDPQLPLARLRVRDQLTEVRAADLRFTAAEAATFLNQIMQLSLSAEDVAALEARTEGWIAGLQLAALSMRGRRDIANFIRAFAGDNRMIVDYVVEEVLQRQPQEVQQFLLSTSILERMSGDLCDAVMGRLETRDQRLNDSNLQSPISNLQSPISNLQSQSLLEHLERTNLFVIPLDDQRHWFRYHHLFADLLRAHLLEQQPTRIPLLHQRASEWYEAQGLLSDAIDHAFAGSDFERAARLIEGEWRNHHRTQFRSATLLSWMRTLPDAMVRASPFLSTGYGWELLNNGEIEAASQRLHDAEMALEAAGERNDPRLTAGSTELRSLQMDIASARAYLSLAHNDLSGAIAHGQRAIELCPADDHLARALVEALLGLAKMATGNLEGAYHSMSAAQRGVHQAGNTLFAIGMTYAIADIQIAQGRLRAAVRTYEAALVLAGIQPAMPQPNPILQGTTDLYLGLGDLHHELGNVALAHENLQKSEALGEAIALANWRYRLRLIQARFKESEGDWERALALLDEAERVYYRSPVPEVRPLSAMRARVWIAQGRLDEAMQWADGQGLSVKDDLSFRREFEHIILARLLIAHYQQAYEEGLLHDAIDLLVRLLKEAEAGERMSSVIEILLLQALAHEAQGDDTRAIVPLQRALTLAEPEGFVRIFVAEGAPMRELLSQALAQKITPTYTSKLLAAFPNPTTLLSKQFSIPNPQSPISDPLSERELEVLRLIAQGLSNQAIGAQLFLALDTVKGHNRRIFEKLQVQRRTEAVARARELGLV